jgi:hypothetical protein
MKKVSKPSIDKENILDLNPMEEDESIVEKLKLMLAEQNVALEKRNETVEAL